jgi:uncharacterized protein (DUF58 family)
VSLFLVRDPREEDLDFAGTVRFEDLEGGPTTTVEVAAVGPGYRRRWAAHQERLEAGCAARGIRVLPLGTTNEPRVILERFLGGGPQLGSEGRRA